METALFKVHFETNVTIDFTIDFSLKKKFSHTPMSVRYINKI